MMHVLARMRKPETSASLKPKIARPTKTVYLPKRDFEQLRKRKCTEQLTPKYFKDIELGTVVILRQLYSESKKSPFVLARLNKHPKNPFLRVYSK